MVFLPAMRTSLVRFGLCAVTFTALVGTIAACSSRASARGQNVGLQEVSDCDTYAAHPDDVNRWAPGVADGAIVPGLAVQRCASAVSKSTKTARFHFQLGRALLANQHKDDALRSFEKANELGYCPAKYYLAAAIEADDNGAQKFDEAVKLYEAAEQCGFAPAIERLNELSFTGDGYEAPKLLQALYEGNIDTLNKARLPVALYLQGFHEYMAMDFHPVSQDCPALVARAAVVYDLDAAVDGDSRLGAVSSAVLTSILSHSPNAITAVIDPVYFGDLEKLKTYFKGIGKRDAIQLIDTFGGSDHGCTSDITKRLYDELVTFAKAKKELKEYVADLLPNTVALFGGLGVPQDATEAKEAKDASGQ